MMSMLIGSLVTDKKNIDINTDIVSMYKGNGTRWSEEWGNVPSRDYRHIRNIVIAIMTAT